MLSQAINQSINQGEAKMNPFATLLFCAHVELLDEINAALLICDEMDHFATELLQLRSLVQSALDFSGSKPQPQRMLVSVQTLDELDMAISALMQSDDRYFSHLEGLAHRVCKALTVAA
jgi:hypothetical protein